MSKVIYRFAFIVLIGFAHSDSLKSIPLAFIQSIINFIKGPLKLGQFFTRSDTSSKSVNKVSKYSRRIRLAIIPVAVTGIFIAIFKGANPVFDKFTSDILERIATFLENLFINFSLGHLVFIGLGFAIILWIIYAKTKNKLESLEASFKDDLVRDRKRKWRFKTTDLNAVGLTNEFKAGLILLVLVNVLLLIINAIDIHWIWFGFDYNNAIHLSQFVHEGTYLLIGSILLSMIILLFLFRQNQNFYPKSNLLKTLSYVWIGQNVILIISVCLRNYYYIHEFGLAYKRIGVMFFLAATIFGVITMAYKIYKTKSGFYLTKINSWMVYAVFIIMSLVNWDQVIVNHNISFSKPGNIDVGFLMTLSDKTLPTLMEHTEQLEHMGWKNLGRSGVKQDINFNYKVSQFNIDWNNYSWLSWNYADHKTYAYLLENHSDMFEPEIK